MPSGDDLLYVGDHIFADILRSKRSLGWRTCLIVPELQSEVSVFQQMDAERQELMDLKRKQYRLENELDVLYNQHHQEIPSKFQSGDAMTVLLSEHDVAVDCGSWSSHISTGISIGDHARAEIAGEKVVAADDTVEIDAPGEDVAQEEGDYAAEWARRETELSLLRAEIRSKLAAYDSAFHRRWGQVCTCTLYS